MLILSRKPNEAVTIGDEVKVRVLSISGKQVRLGIEAPNEVAVHREEIYERIVEEKNASDDSQESSLDSVTNQ